MTQLGPVLPCRARPQVLRSLLVLHCDEAQFLELRQLEGHGGHGHAGRHGAGRGPCRGAPACFACEVLSGL